jgi:hypothetical protein
MPSPACPHFTPTHGTADDFVVPSPTCYSNASRHEIATALHVARLAADAHPYLHEQAHEILEHLKRIGRATRATDEQVKTAFERIREAALIARYECQQRLFEIEDTRKSVGYALFGDLDKVARRGRIPRKAHASLFDALIYGLVKAGLTEPPLVARSFDSDTHPLEPAIRSMPSRVIRKAAETAHAPDGMLLDDSKAPSDGNKGGLIAYSGENSHPVPRKKAMGSDSILRLLAAVTGEYQELSGDIAVSRTLVELAELALLPVDPLSPKHIRKLLKKQ